METLFDQALLTSDASPLFYSKKQISFSKFLLWAYEIHACHSQQFTQWNVTVTAV